MLNPACPYGRILTSEYIEQIANK